MLRNYFKIALRHLWQNRLYSSINVIGLAFGLTCVLLAILYIRDEHNFDTFHQKSPDLYRITTTLIAAKGEDPQTSGGTGQVQGPAFKAAIPEMEEYVRVMGGAIFGDIRTDRKAFKLQLLFADDNFFNVFSFKLIHGNPKTVLKDVGSVVITEKTALKFFNSTNVVGKILHMEADPSADRLGKPLVVSGVVENPPKNSSIQFDVLHPFSFMQLSFEDTAWLNAYLGTFVVLNPKADKALVIKKFNQVHAQHAQEQIKENGHNPETNYGLQPITDIHLNHLNTGGEGGAINYSNPLYSYVFLGIAIFILLMASINFVNISIASSLKRAKEVGIRKVTGSHQSQIIIQFLGESAILCVTAFLLALVFMLILLPIFNELANKQIEIGEIFEWRLIFSFIIVLLVNILLSGLYPAYMLSNFKPAEVLYSKQKLSGGGFLGQSLVVLQFALAAILLIASIVFYQQMNYVRTKDLGYNPYQVIRSYISGNRETKPFAEFIKNEVAKEPSIVQISFGEDRGSNYKAKVNQRTVKSSYQNIDQNYFSVLGIRLKEGRNLSSNQEVIVNEAFVKASALANPIGALIKTEDFFIKSPARIVGVVKDFHFGSLRNRISPLVMTTNDVYHGGIWLKIDKNRQQEAIKAFEKIYRKALPNAVYEYSFMDELNNRDYIQEQRWQKIIGFATLLSMLLCGMGLFGLTHLAAQQRTKEIGIRKVLGASVMSIVALLSKNFLKLSFISVIVASPIAFYFMDKWLQGFAYRIQISWNIFGYTAFIIIFISFLTVTYQAIQAALMNPVDSIKTE
ncbi:ABC transporter permease [Runella aurantiaca]|uniref:ABC transporter permease n=1 Tax=Runella aurantiaca TaxID=2282308 RepID=A0A369IAQ3_9BACT|nr:ABC transporter permease [Runella aurantiaca]RDB05365.1 ABC transporter permease [Runella aurantiaca]